MAATQNFYLQVDWNNDGDWGDTGEEMASRVLKLQYRRGREQPSQLTGHSLPGKLVAILNNESGDYSSFNTSSPLTGNILPGRKVRVLGSGAGGFTYTFPFAFDEAPLWQGFLSRIVPIVTPGGLNHARLEAIGPLGYLNQKETRVAMQTARRTDQGIGDILDDLGWPAGDRDLDTGKTTMARFWINKSRGLHALRKVEDTEGGFLRETRDGKVKFEQRQARLASPHTVSQAAFSDAVSAPLPYRGIEQDDPLASIYNIFEATVTIYSVGALTTLWTNPENKDNPTPDSPAIKSGESLVFWAAYPPGSAGVQASEIAGHVAVDAWTTPVATTDYTVHTAADGAGTDLTGSVAVAVSKFGAAMKITLTNNHASDGFVTTLKARGTPVVAADPVRIREEDAASQKAYGERTYPNPAEFLPDSDEARQWAKFYLSIFKEPLPTLRMRVIGSRDSAMMEQVLEREVSDRVTLTANSTRTGLGINEDFFIEALQVSVRPAWVEAIFDLSPASGWGGWWTPGVTPTGAIMKVAY